MRSIILSIANATHGRILRRSVGPSPRQSTLKMFIFMMVGLGAGRGRTPPKSIPPLPVRRRRATDTSSASMRAAGKGGGADAEDPNGESSPVGGPTLRAAGERGGGGQRRAPWAKGRVAEPGDSHAAEEAGVLLPGWATPSDAMECGGVRSTRSGTGGPPGSCRAAATCAAATNSLKSDTPRSHSKKIKKHRFVHESSATAS